MIQIKKIEFHGGDDASYHFHGEDAYSLPAGRPAAAVTFEIRDQDRVIQMTEVITQRVGGYDAIVRVASELLKVRLQRLGKMGEELVVPPGQQQ